ncbi:uncharacterized protein LOC127258685 [Andrographis paniculata]|uniref:uncharacterized protein LOC127258685 n=1 Tax=Andrographis paniculata TaxID=175694 RepID=UPI0021E7329F|nr:uncharacterized protein LOC127258685 [Andrographis paniculata]
MLLVCVFGILWLQLAVSSSGNGDLSARELDSLLQEYAFEALVRPKTGIVYDGEVPANLTGIKVAALRLRSGSLRRRGVVSGYKEYRLPIGVVEQPYVTRVVLVYHNLGDLSSMYYPLPGYTFLAPVLGLLAYDASDLSARNLSELDIRAAGDPIAVVFPAVRSDGYASPPMCVQFGLDGSVGFENVVNGSTCLTTSQGHISIVVASPPSPAPAPAPGGGGGTAAGSGGGKTSSKKVWIIAGSIVGGGALLVALSVLFLSLRQCSRRKKIRRMEIASEAGIPLPMTPVGSTKAPVASETRTRPSLENEFVP